MPNRPQEMYSGDRQPVQEFDSDELFYYRVDPEFIQPDGSVLPVHVHCPNLSCNRSKFSQTWYVLFPLDKFGLWAVFQFDFNEVDKKIKGDGQDATVYDVVMIHCPLVDNYAHCEVRILRNGKAMKEAQINRTAKGKFKLSMSRCLHIARPPYSMPQS